jgi:hypothetical protein
MKVSGDKIKQPEKLAVFGLLEFLSFFSKGFNPAHKPVKRRTEQEGNQPKQE